MAKRAASSTGSTSRRGKGAKAADTAAKSPASPPAGGRSASGSARGGRSSGKKFQAFTAGSAKGKHLVIVESPSKAKTINKYLGPDYLVLASIGHVRDLPSKNPKGVKSPVPGVDLERDFRPTYQVSEGKEKVISDLKRAAKETLSTGGEVWFATDLDREGEAIAWHLAQELGISPSAAKRVVFAAITKDEINRAFSNPHPINEDRVNAQQARRILDRIVGYQVSPLLWKKVARGLSAGRVQSVAVRLVVAREREIRAFIPEESWEIDGIFTTDAQAAPRLAQGWSELLARGVMVEKREGPAERKPTPLKVQQAWLAEHGGFRATLVSIAGEKPNLEGSPADTQIDAEALAKRAAEVAALAGLREVASAVRIDPEGKGPARFVRTITGRIDPAVAYQVASIETRRTTSRPPPPFITSTLQQAGANRLGFAAQRTMRTAQQLYEGVDIPGEGPVGLITYMRTDSTHLSKDALEAARSYIGRSFGPAYLPEKPNFFSSSNKDAQEAHEAIRPTNVAYSPDRLRNVLSPDQFRLYQIIWERFVACQMTPAQWDGTSAMLVGGTDPARPCTFRASGRVLVFDGFFRVSGIPTFGEEQTLPALRERQDVRPFALDPRQKFTSPPPRYSEASLIKELEAQGIGRPSTYASIISVIQDRKYVEKQENRFYATDLGEVVTDKLIEAFPEIMDVGYTRDMEGQLDKVEEDHLDWIDMLRKFYGPFQKSLEAADSTLKHAKAEESPAPPEYTCPTCENEGRGKSPLVYRFGKNGRFLSCSKFSLGVCKYASPIDREGRPRPAAETVDVACHKCGGPMIKRVGRFGPFLGCARFGDAKAPCDGILNLDKKGKVEAPSAKPLLTDLPCPTCGEGAGGKLYLRGGVRGPWLSCNRFPKCRGRGKWAELPEDQRAALEKQLADHERANPIPIIKTMDGKPLTGPNGKPLPTALPVGLKGDEAGETFESVAEELGV